MDAHINNHQPNMDLAKSCFVTQPVSLKSFLAERLNGYQVSSFEEEASRKSSVNRDYADLLRRLDSGSKLRGGHENIILSMSNLDNLEIATLMTPYFEERGYQVASSVLSWTGHTVTYRRDNTQQIVTISPFPQSKSVFISVSEIESPAVPA